MREQVNKILNRHPAVGLAVGVFRHGRLDFFHGHGVADVAARTPVTEETVFRVGSITKTFTAIAVMQLWEQGDIDLDAPAGEYLRAYELIPAKPGWRPVTVRHLLTHTAGIGEVLHASGLLRPLFGETVPAGSPVPPLAEYYARGLRIQAEPGSRWRYTDHGFATLGQIVADASGLPFENYLRENVFEPLGMDHTDVVRSERVRAHLATGYELRSGGPKQVADYEVVTAGGGAAYSTPADIARYVEALLGGGANQHGSILKPETLQSLFAPQFGPDPRISRMGLAFWLGTAGGHRIAEHGGIVPGFTSQIFLAPDDDVAVMAFTNGASRAMFWLPGETAALLDEVLGVEHGAAIRTGVPPHPELWNDLCGWYRLPGPLTDVRGRSMAGAGVEVFVRGGRLMLRVIGPIPVAYKGFELHPDDENDPYAFRVDLSALGIGTGRIVFSQEPAVGTTAIHFDLQPVSAFKRPAVTNPRLWASGALGALAMATAAIVLRRRRPR